MNLLPTSCPAGIVSYSSGPRHFLSSRRWLYSSLGASVVFALIVSALRWPGLESEGARQISDYSQPQLVLLEEITGGEDPGAATRSVARLLADEPLLKVVRQGVREPGQVSGSMVRPALTIIGTVIDGSVSLQFQRPKEKRWTSAPPVTETLVLPLSRLQDYRAVVLLLTLALASYDTISQVRRSRLLTMLDLRTQAPMDAPQKERFRTAEIEAAWLHARGMALLRVGGETDSSGKLWQAAALFGKEIRTLEGVGAPAAQAAAENRLGETLVLLGDRVGEQRRLRSAAAKAHRKATERLAPSKYSYERAATTYRYASALSHRRATVDDLIESLDAYRSLEEEISKQTLPHEWGTLQRAIANTLRFIGEREGTSDRYLLESTVAFSEALNHLDGGRVRAVTQREHGTALMQLWVRRKEERFGRAAVSAFEAALASPDIDSDRLMQAGILGDLARTYQSLAIASCRVEDLRAAERAFRRELVALASSVSPALKHSADKARFELLRTKAMIAGSREFGAARWCS